MGTIKIGLLNFQHSMHNYGAVLQAAALEYTLRNEGYNVEHINYIPKSKISLKSIVKKLALKVNMPLKIKNSAKGNIESFENFRNSFITRTNLISTGQEFSKTAKNYDAIIVGSDQVWRPKMSSDPFAYFLGYVPVKTQRIAYAASFGTSSWELNISSSITNKLKKELLKFDAISCRESSGVEICRSVFEVESEHVLDPLLQVADEFLIKVMQSASVSGKKVVFYKLDRDENFDKSLKLLELEYGYDAHDLYRKNGSLNEYEEVFQWVRNIYDSDVVISDSFHCICLGLRFDRKVIYWPNPKRGQARLDDLFEYLDIKKNQVEFVSDEMFELFKGPNFTKRLHSLKAKSIKFIRNSLSTVNS